MAELLRRLLFRPVLFAELIIISFFINLLALAPTLYVIQLFNRYLAHGVHGTLVTLTFGALIALGLEILFRWLRQHIAASISVRPNKRLAIGAFDAMLGVKNVVIASMPTSAKQEMLRGINKVHDAYSPTNIITFLDLPFSFLIIVVLYLLNPPLALIAFIGLSIAVAAGLFGQRFISRPARFLMETIVNQTGLINIASQFFDVVKGFNGQKYFSRLWTKELFISHVLKYKVADRAAIMQIVTSTITSLLTISIISVGAMQVVEGTLSIGALIGANILATRALMPAIKFISLASLMTESEQSLNKLKELSRLPRESDIDGTLKKFNGLLDLKDLAFVYHGSPVPLFESLSLRLNPGLTLGVVGVNGSGKTTLARLLAGLLDPNRGQVFIDGVALTQLSQEWWRRQIIYVPQEATLFSGTIRDNILLNNPKLSSKKINSILQRSDLKTFVDTSPKGLETKISQNGQTLSLGIRRRLAIARGLVSDGQLVIFDEPTEGLDTSGQQAVYRLLNQFVQDGKTIIVFSHDQNILKGANLIMDMSVKPVPKISEINPAAYAGSAEKIIKKKTKSVKKQKVPSKNSKKTEGQKKHTKQAAKIVSKVEKLKKPNPGQDNRQDLKAYDKD